MCKHSSYFHWIPLISFLTKKNSRLSFYSFLLAYFSWYSTEWLPHLRTRQRTRRIIIGKSFVEDAPLQTLAGAAKNFFIIQFLSCFPDSRIFIQIIILNALFFPNRLSAISRSRPKVLRMGRLNSRFNYQNWLVYGPWCRQRLRTTEDSERQSSSTGPLISADKIQLKCPSFERTAIGTKSTILSFTKNFKPSR